jgi:DNA invertase Pin-like site-specific DNA recombinase
MTKPTALIPLTAYARTSTDDQQNPGESLRWQLSRANALIVGRAEIVSVTHDTDVSRSVPWPRRPEAARLIAQLPNPARGWAGIIVGEPQRAFGSAGQVQNILPQLAHWGVQLWVPEVGGPIDPDSEAHDLLMSMFGGLSKAERNRLRVRVRTSMKAMAPEGRYLGGRPPYGYRLDRTGVAHPNPEKARQGIELTNLVVHPETSKVVQQIFAWRIEGVGFRAIAARLSEQGVPCPSAADRERNSHRRGRAWSVSAVRAIVMNPKYKGQGNYGRYRKVERLFDVNDPAAGHVTRMSPAPAAEVIKTDGIVAPIVTESAWQQAQSDRSPARPGPRTDRSQPTRFALRGLLVCAKCGRRMQGHTVKRRSGAQRLGYQCAYRTDYPGDDSHPKSLFVAEDRILPAVDGWLSDLTSPKRLDDTVTAILEADTLHSTEPPELGRARRQAAEARKKLDQYLAALDAGMDPALLAERTRAVQSELMAATAVIDTYKSAGPSLLTGKEVYGLLEGIGGLTQLLAESDTDGRQRVYRSAGVHLCYERTSDGEKVTASLRVPQGINVQSLDQFPAWGLSRVGGGT